MIRKDKTAQWIVAGVIVVALGLAFSAGCSRWGSDHVAAYVNESPITMERLRRALSTEFTIAEEVEARPQVVRAVLEQLIEEELAFQEAKAAGIEVSEEELAQATRRIQADYPGEAFEEMLVKEYLLPQEWEDNVYRGLMVNHMIVRVIRARIEFAEADWKPLVEAYAREMVLPPLTLVQQITLDTAEAAQTLYKELAAGLDFNAAAARLHLDDMITPRWVDPEYLPPELKSVIIGTQPGEISPVAASEYGFTIFRVLERTEPRLMEPQQAESYILRKNFSQREPGIYREWIDQARARARIRLNPALGAAAAGLGRPADEIK